MTAERDVDKAAGLTGRLLGVQVLGYIPGSFVPALAGVLSAAIFTRALSSAAYGRFSLVQSVAVLLSTLASQWLIQSVNRFLPSATTDKAKKESHDAIVLSLVLIGVVVVVGALLAGLVLGGVVGPDWRPLLVPAAALVLTTSLLQPMRTVLQARMQAGSFSANRMWEVILRFVLALLLVFLVSRTAASLLWAGPLAMAILVPPLWIHTRLPSLARVLRRWRELKGVLRRWSVYGFPMIGWFLGAVLLSVGDRYVIQAVRGEVEVGIYAANYGLVAGAAGLIAAPVRLAAHPFLMRAWGNGDRDTAGKWLGTIIELSLVGTVLIAGPFFLLARDIVQIVLGPEFREGYLVIPIVLAGVGFHQLGLYTHKPLEFMERTRVMLVLCLGVAGINVGLNLALVPVYGYHAAAWTTLICYGLYAVLSAYWGRTVLRWQIRWKALSLTLLVLAMGFGAAGVARSFIGSSYGPATGLAVALLVMVGTVVFGLLRITQIPRRELQ